MADSLSRQSIQRLRAQGWTDQRIAKAVGRDSSLIKQIRDGKKPGNNLADALRAVENNRPVPVPPRRQQRVRRRRQRTVSGRYIHTYGPGEAKSFLRKLRTLAKRGKRVQLIVLFRRVLAYGRKKIRHNEEVPLYAKGGRLASDVVADMERWMKQHKTTDPWEALEHLASQRPDIDEAEGVLAVTIYELG